MGNRSTTEVRRELESERERLERAATTLRTQSGNVAKRIALTAAAAAAVGIAVKVVASRVFGRDEAEKQGRARLPFPGRD
jgi:hypothetical protein